MRPHKKSHAEKAYEQIENMIVCGELKPESIVSESDLISVLKWGRTPVRDALQRLQFEGLVEIRARQGILITPVDVRRQLELLEVRRPLEALMVDLAARRASSAQRDEMRRLADELESALNAEVRDRYFDINKRIHEIEAEACDNRFMQRQMNTIHRQSRRFWYSFITDTESFRAAAHLHARTIRAIADGDVEGGARSVGELMDQLESAARSSIDMF